MGRPPTRVVESLPSEFPVSEAAPPEGDPHFNAKVDIRESLSRHFGRLKRRVYLACELPVYYPGESMFAPDVLAVVDADLHPRQGWVVSAEGRCLDVALEVHVSGRRLKDVERNVAFSLLARSGGVEEEFTFTRDQERRRAARGPAHDLSRGGAFGAARRPSRRRPAQRPLEELPGWLSPMTRVAGGPAIP